MTQLKCDEQIQVLLVDDEAPYRQTLARRLERRNMAILQACLLYTSDAADE